MLVILLCILIAVLAVEIWAVAIVISRQKLNRWVRIFYWVCLPLAFIAGFAMTGYYSYYANANTHVFGWPVPCVIFQRDTPTSPWLDYVGPTVIFAYPINFVLYLFVPSLVVVILSCLRRKTVL